jgi:hypothetical protein
MLRLALLTLTSLALLGACSRTTPDTLVAVAEREPAREPELDTLGRHATIELALSVAPSDPIRLAIVEGLRASGPASVDALILDYQRAAPSSAEAHAAWRGLIDQVAQQRDAHYGGLFWLRDMNEARAAAAATGKPILSLRLLGDLGSEYSCANSRLFRTLLYADPELAAWLEQEFVLHWSSERPVPRLDIDFGDGRRIARTITGNSAHFVLDARGRTLDVIPGLIARDGFQAALTASLELHAELDPIVDDARWRASLAAAHELRFTTIAERMTEQLSLTRAEPLERDALETWLGRSPNPSRERVPALAAVPMAIGKSRIEAPILAAAPRELGGPAPTPAELRPSEAELWQLGVAATSGEPRLHPNSEAIITGERPLDGLVPAEQRPEAELALRAALLRSLMVDTGKNLYEMRARVAVELARRARDEDSLGFAEVDAWIYAELFETPASDPWLGLVDPTVYTGLDAGGVGSPGLDVARSNSGFEVEG